MTDKALGDVVSDQQLYDRRRVTVVGGEREERDERDERSVCLVAINNQ
jgi:hypothetical protein